MRAKKVNWEETKSGLLIPSTISGGDASEDAVQLLAEQSFFPDFVFRSPKRKSGRHEKEITDVLIWFDDKLVSVQVKSMNADIASLTETTEWARTNLNNAFKQAKGAKRHLLTASNKSRLANDRRGIIELVHDEVAEFHSLIVLDHPQHSYYPSELVPELNSAAISTHVLTLEDFRNVCAEFTTVPDFLAYLEARQQLLQAQSIEVGREIDLLAWYILTRRGKAEEMGFDTEIPTGLGEEFLATYQDRLRKRTEADAPSFYIDEIIDKAHILDPTLSPQSELASDPELLKTAYVEVAVDLGYLRRVERRTLGRKLREKAQLSAEQGINRWFPVSPNKRGTAFLFLTSPFDRVERREELHFLTALAKYRMKANRCLGIATEHLNGVGRSYDFDSIEYPWTEDPEIDEMCEQYFSAGAQISVEEFPE